MRHDDLHASVSMQGAAGGDGCSQGASASRSFIGLEYRSSLGIGLIKGDFQAVATRLAQVGYCDCSIIGINNRRTWNRDVCKRIVSMSLFCLSFAHQRVPIELRERIFLDSDSIANACARFRCGSDHMVGVTELAILSTCNRTEIYGYVSGDLHDMESSVFGDLQGVIHQFLVTARDVDVTELQDHGRWLTDADAASHLARVAAGLESLVVGEPQILGQVGDALRLGLAMNSVGPILTKLFQTAVRSGRRARNETLINRQSLNVATVAVNTAERELGSLQGKTIVVLGAGEMAELALLQLTRRGADDIRIVNRSIDRARELSDRVGGKPFVFERMSSLLADADVLLCSTGAPHTIVTRSMVATAIESRPQRPLTILDVAVPRDVDPQVASLANVTCCDMDDLQVATGQAVELRNEQIPLVEAIIEAEVDHLLAWLRSVGVESVIAQLHRKAEKIRASELDRLAALLADQDRPAWETVERFSRALMKKILHDPVVQLRQQSGSRKVVDSVAAIQELFQLDALSESIREDDPTLAAPLQPETRVTSP